LYALPRRRRDKRGVSWGLGGPLVGRRVSAGVSYDWPAARQRILARYLELLALADSPLLHAGEAVLEQVKRQLLGTVDAVRDILAGSRPDERDQTGTQLSEAIGRTRATARIHPSQSLRAASLIFEAALPTIAGELRTAGVPDPELAAGVALNAEILRRMSEAARAYVDYLLEKAQSSNRDERRRLSRELHDVAAPAVAIGLQNLELFDVYAGQDPARAATKIDAARQSLMDALATIRNLSAQSRESVATNGFTEAIHRYVDTLPADIKTDVRIDGELDELMLSYAEELFLIVREAVRNAVDHGAPTEVAIRIHADADELRAWVIDDGRGFDVERTLAAEAHVGIESMYERAELLGANLSIESRPDEGTTVSISISLPSASPAEAS
jgi:signal transduction histidine kinase